MRSLHLKGWALCRLLGRFGYFGPVCFDEHFQHRSQHSGSRTAHKTRKILAIQSIHKRYWIGKVKGSAEQWAEGLSSEIACVGLSFRHRNSSRAGGLGSWFSEFLECHWRAIDCYLQFYIHTLSECRATRDDASKSRSSSVLVERLCQIAREKHSLLECVRRRSGRL